MLKPIPGFPGYSVTDDGRVWSDLRTDLRGHCRRGRWLSAKLDRKGYFTQTLYMDGKRRDCHISRLVLETFIGPCPVGMEACHNNGKSKDNRVENLRWDTRSANSKDAVKHGTCPFLQTAYPHARGTRQARAKLTETAVRWIRCLCKAGISRRELAEGFNVTKGAIGSILNGHSWGWL